MLTVIEPAFTQKWPEFDKSMFKFIGAEMMQAEFLQAWRVYQYAFIIQMVQVGCRGRVLAAIQYRADLLRANGSIRQECIYHGGLAHA